MNHETMEERVRQALDAELSGLRTTPGERDRMYANVTGGTKVKRKLTMGLVLAIVLVLITAAAIAAALLTRKEIVEQVAVPLAIENDPATGVQEKYTPEQLARLVRALNENGFTLEENSTIMQCLQNGQGYYEEETIMEICRQAFGGNFYNWTLEEQDWFNHLMVDVGFYESYESCLPGEGTMSYEEAESFAFETLKKEYGKKVEPENREQYKLGRQLFRDIENDNRLTWNFSLEPKSVEYGNYNVVFEDRDPAGTVYTYASIPDWTHSYTGDDVMMAFYNVHSWASESWQQSVWHKMHLMMEKANLNPESTDYPEYRGYQLTDYPEPADGEISREEAIRIGKETLKLDRAALNSAVLTEFEGERAWLVTLLIYPPEDGTEDEESGIYTVTVDSASGEVKSFRKWTEDDNNSMPFVPEKAYEKAREGRLKTSDFIRLAAEAVKKEYPGLDLLNEDEYAVSSYGGRRHYLTFRTKNILHGNVNVTMEPDGTVSEIEADTEPLSGDNLMTRYRMVYGYFGEWEQKLWVQLAADLEKLDASSLEGKLLKAGLFPEESSVSIGRAKAQELAIQAVGKRSVEINTCILIHAEPHPVWKMRLLTDTPDDPVIELDAETGEVTATDIFKTDYTPTYVLYSLEKNWRKAELETLGVTEMAKREITYRFMDLWLDFPEPDFGNPDEYETAADGLTVRFTGRWAGMKDYLTEFDENGYVVRCEETDSKSTETRPEPDNGDGGDTAWHGAMYYAPDDAPAPREDGKPWVWEMDFAPAEFWKQLEETMEKLGVNANNLMEQQQIWYEEYGDNTFWPQEMKICCDLLITTPQMVEERGRDFTYPVFPAPGKKTEEEIRAIAEQHMRAELVPEMGEEWVEKLKYGACLWNSGYLPDENRELDYPCWVCQYFAYENRDWNAKYYMLINEDGEILYSEYWADSNG